MSAAAEHTTSTPAVHRGWIPATRAAALDEVAASNPGVKVVKNAEDILDRTGIGILWPGENGNPAISSFVVVFDTRTHTYLGWHATTDGGLRQYGSAQITAGLVDAAGRRP